MDYDIYTLKNISSLLAEKLTGAAVNSIITHKKGKIVFELSCSNPALEYSMLPGLEYIKILSKYSKAKKNFAAILPEVSGSKINNIECLNIDRIIRVKLNSGCELLFSFINTRRNCLVVNEGVIVNSFKDSNTIKGTAVKDYFPDNTQHIDEFQNIDEYLRTKYFRFNKNIRNEILSKTGFLKSESLDNWSRGIIDDLFKEIEVVPSKKCFVIARNSELFISPIKITGKKFSLQGEHERFEDAYSDALRLQYGMYREKTVKEKVLHESEKKIKILTKKLSSLKNHLTVCETSNKMLNFGNTILANMDLVKPGSEYLECDDIKGNRVKIKLKRQLKPSENAQLYFEKYSGQKESISVLKIRITQIEKELLIAQKEFDSLSAKDDLKSISKMEKEFLKEKSEEELKKLFRKFVLTDKYEVWVGKDSYSNDLLTTKYSSPHDLWFHVRGSSGSHTVLRVHGKKDLVDKQYILNAASIAAYYSKARNASIVTVAYCERKFVKKKKGMKTGSVIMEREKVVNVKPSLPGQ